MPVTAPDTRSLPERGVACNTATPKNSQTRARCALRLAAVTDHRLSLGARALYVLLDDYAGMRAECWPRQETAGERLGYSVRSVKRWIAELVAAGYITIRRTQTGNRYRLAWAIKAQAQFGPSQVPIPARRYIEPVQGLRGCNSNSTNAPKDEPWEFGVDDAVRLFDWAQNHDPGL